MRAGFILHTCYNSSASQVLHGVAYLLTFALPNLQCVWTCAPHQSIPSVNTSHRPIKLASANWDGNAENCCFWYITMLKRQLQTGTSQHDGLEHFQNWLRHRSLSSQTCVHEHFLVWFEKKQAMDHRKTGRYLFEKIIMQMKTEKSKDFIFCSYVKRPW